MRSIGLKVLYLIQSWLKYLYICGSNIPEADALVQVFVAGSEPVLKHLLKIPLPCIDSSLYIVLLERQS